MRAGLKRALREIEIREAAVSAVEGDATLCVPVVNGIAYTGWATVEPKNQLVELPTHVIEEIKVRTVRPDRMALGDIGFVKIDIEGNELDVLAGLSGCSSRSAALNAELAKFGAASTHWAMLRLGLMRERDLLKALANHAESRGSPNVIFIPMNGLLSDHIGSAGPV